MPAQAPRDQKKKKAHMTKKNTTKKKTQTTQFDHAVGHSTRSDLQLALSQTHPL